jgi:hypothetical protein
MVILDMSSGIKTRGRLIRVVLALSLVLGLVSYWCWARYCDTRPGPSYPKLDPIWAVERDALRPPGDKNYPSVWDARLSPERLGLLVLTSRPELLLVGLDGRIA